MNIDITKNTDKTAHFFYGYWLNIFGVAIAAWLINAWIGVALLLAYYIVREIKQKKTGGTNDFQEQIADVLFSIVTAIPWALLLPFVIDRVW
ncbi:hypothetical protein HSX10_03745 [Winogradskyella undariae]|uniref:hypothetical protein n=1 Tax=Winogradskyella undariae TaxID=1285465 RepID=UPI00156B87F7|nr:hypothetical protein [Winogradskyella undariae]NRR90673.1 hypothetical protein [Winogradskyella undariae]